LGLERETGSLEVGKSADLIVLDNDILAAPATEIASTKVLLTILRGEEVYRDGAFAGSTDPPSDAAK
jgi:hypothetical protein